jgi:prephenate dehydratase
VKKEVIKNIARYIRKVLNGKNDYSVVPVTGSESKPRDSIEKYKSLKA